MTIENRIEELILCNESEKSGIPKALSPYEFDFLQQNERAALIEELSNLKAALQTAERIYGNDRESLFESSQILLEDSLQKAEATLSGKVAEIYSHYKIEEVKVFTIELKDLSNFLEKTQEKFLQNSANNVDESKINAEVKFDRTHQQHEQVIINSELAAEIAEDSLKPIIDITHNQENILEELRLELDRDFDEN